MKVFAARVGRRTSRRVDGRRPVRVAVALALAGVLLGLVHAMRGPTWRGHDVLGIALGVGILAFGVGLVLAIVRETNPGTRPKTSAVRAAATPPGPLQPALAGALVTGDARMVHAVACVFDLVRRGCLQLELVDADKPHVAAAWHVRRSRGTLTLTDWERSVLESVCPKSGEAVATPVAWRMLRGQLPEIRKRIRVELQRSGDLDPEASERRRGLYATSLVSAILGVGGLAAAAGLAQRLGPTGFAPGFALLVVAAIAFAAAVNMTRLTRAGGRRAAAWMGFARFVRACTGRGASLDAETFDRDLGYAIAFGLGPAWLRAAKREGLDAPGWFGGSRVAARPLAALEAQLVASGAHEQSRQGHAVHTAG